MDMQNMTNSQNSLNRLSSAIDELITVLAKQKNEHQTAISDAQEQTAAANAKVSVLQAQMQSVLQENEQLSAQLQQAQDNAETEARLQSLQNELEIRNNKISGLQTEVQNLNTALSNRKNQIEELKVQIADLEDKLAAAEQKAAEMEINSQNNTQVNAEIQAKLNEEVLQRDLWEQKYQDSAEKILQMQQTISETTENIDDVVSRLEKVLEEHGAGNNNN